MEGNTRTMLLVSDGGDRDMHSACSSAEIGLMPQCTKPIAHKHTLKDRRTGQYRTPAKAQAYMHARRHTQTNIHVHRTSDPDPQRLLVSIIVNPARRSFTRSAVQRVDTYADAVARTDQAHITFIHTGSSSVPSSTQFMNPSRLGCSPAAHQMHTCTEHTSC